MDTGFINSPIGRKFLEQTMPNIGHQLKRLNEHLEKLIAIEEEEVIDKSIGDVNKEIKEGMENIINIRKEPSDWTN